MLMDKPVRVPTATRASAPATVQLTSSNPIVFVTLDLTLQIPPSQEIAKGEFSYAALSSRSQLILIRAPTAPAVRGWKIRGAARYMLLEKNSESGGGGWTRTNDLRIMRPSL